MGVENVTQEWLANLEHKIEGPFYSKWLYTLKQLSTLSLKYENKSVLAINNLYDGF